MKKLLTLLLLLGSLLARAQWSGADNTQFRTIEGLWVYDSLARHNDSIISYNLQLLAILDSLALHLDTAQQHNVKLLALYDSIRRHTDTLQAHLLRFNSMVIAESDPWWRADSAHIYDSLTRHLDSLQAHNVRLGGILDSLLRHTDSLAAHNTRINLRSLIGHTHALNDLSEKSYNNLTDKPTIPAAQIQSDWNQANNALLDFIKNKPSVELTSNKTNVTGTSTTLYATQNLVKYYGDSLGGIIIPLWSIGLDSSVINTTYKHAFGISQGFVIDTLMYVTSTLGAGTTNITPKIYYGTDIEAAGTAIITSPSAMTSHTTVTKISTFNNATVAIGNILWITFTDVTTKPRNLYVVIKGHKL